MTVLPITKEDLFELQICRIDEELELDSGRTARILDNSFVEDRRWVATWNLTFAVGDRFYSFNYEVPLTEDQEGSETESTPEGVYEVKPRVIETTIYEKV